MPLADDGRGGDFEEERSERQMEATFDNERRRSGQIAPNKKTFSAPTAAAAISIEGTSDDMTVLDCHTKWSFSEYVYRVPICPRGNLPYKIPP